MPQTYRFFLGFLCLIIGPLVSNADKSEGLPETIDPDRYYLFYLHGQVVEGSDGTPNHPDYGIYKYPEIVEKLEEKGFWVISEIRKRNTNPSTYADLISFYVDQLKEAGVPSSHITIVGGSKGGIIACYVSNKQKDKDLNFVILAGFFYTLRDDPNMEVSGRILSIHDSSDTNNINPKYFLKKSPGVSEQRVVITRERWGHRLIFEPWDRWVKEVVAWSGIPKKSKGKD
ncbi:MAG: hypothetical protein O3C43_19850 [Verrucomicrobia bacterium]|nr:hypothetical protein [Verrucomicrobiota bacterium]MDA1068746.1 hypothetical protein [Verrucomicrobiota bacterium]